MRRSKSLPPEILQLMSRDPRLLIDGYNVLFQSAFTGRGRGKLWLERARQRLLQFLASRLTATEANATLVVFDASHGSGSEPRHAVSAGGITVTFAVDYPEADDLLELIIRKHSHPKGLQVVSSDRRIRRCATTRRAASVDSETFLEQLERRPTKPTLEKPQAALKPPSGSDSIAEKTSTRHSVASIQVDESELAEIDMEQLLRDFGQPPSDPNRTDIQ